AADRGPICGNTLVEGNETCDCGYSESECNDDCCYARQNNDNKEGCSLKPHAKCSPTGGPCCTTECNPVNNKTLCAPEGFCTKKGFCEYPFLPGTLACKPLCEFEETKSLCNLRLQPGSPCNGLRGYCDVFHKCRNVDEEGPLARLQRIFFGTGSINAIHEFVTSHPIVSAVMLIGFVWFMVLMFRCFAVHTPTNNPHKRPAFKLKDTIRRPLDLF
ncbi:unnamed protein product, partial [Ixodes hexagonus]